MCSFQLPVILSRWLFLYERLKERKFEMNKHLLLTGLLAVLTLNNAFAQGYYDEEDDYYYEERPRYTRRSNYQQPRYRDVEYVREEAPRYRRVSSREAVRYREPTYHQAEYYGEPRVNKIRPYIGLDVASQKMKFGEKDYWMKEDGEDYYKDKTTSISGVIGARINRNFGIEAYYQQSSEEEKNNHIITYGYIVDEKSKMSYKSYGVDLIGYMPLSYEFELLAALGIGQYDFETKFIYTNTVYGYGNPLVYDEKENKDFDSLGIRLGIGVQYNVTDNIALRAMARYIKMNDDDYVKNLTELSLGLRYMF